MISLQNGSEHIHVKGTSLYIFDFRSSKHTLHNLHELYLLVHSLMAQFQVQAGAGNLNR